MSNTITTLGIRYRREQFTIRGFARFDSIFRYLLIHTGGRVAFLRTSLHDQDTHFRIIRCRTLVFTFITRLDTFGTIRSKTKVGLVLTTLLRFRIRIGLLAITRWTRNRFATRQRDARLDARYNGTTSQLAIR